MSFESNPRWFFGIIHQPGIWATSAERPGVGVRISNYPCSQDMSPCWVAYLGQVPSITHPKQVTFKDVSSYLTAGLPVYYDRSCFYESKELEDCLKSLDTARAKNKEVEKQIHARAN